MLSESEIDALRPAISQEPEGSPAKQLLAHLDEVRAAKKVADRRGALDICKKRGHSDEEAELLVAAWEAGESCETEQVKCHVCDGWGRSQMPGCMGNQSDTCYNCRGDGRAWRFKLPTRPV